MLKKVYFGISIFALLLIGSVQMAVSQSPGLEKRIRSVETGLLLTETITDRMEAHNVPGLSIAVVNDCDLEWSKGYGVLELGGNRAVTPDSLFQAGSVSKAVTAVGALHYVEREKIDLDENVNDKLESWRVPENEFTKHSKVTLGRLLSHTAGVNQGLNRGYAPGEEIPTLMQSLDGEYPANSVPVRVDRVPGSEQYYSNGGYLIVVQLLQDVLDKPFNEIMTEAVFKPAGMTSSTFDQTLSAELAARVATPHGWDVLAWRESPGLVGENYVHDPGYGGMWTTAPDLARFGIEIIKAYQGESDVILTQEMTDLMLTPVTEGVPMQEPFDVDQGLGFMLLNLGQEAWFIHFGGSFPGYISVLLGQPERGFAVAILTNSWSGYELIWEILYSIFYAYRILPTTGQIFGLGYSLLLFLIAFLFWPIRFVARKRDTKLKGEGVDRKQGRIATIAILTIILTVAAILVLSLLYRGPLGGGLLHSLNTGEMVLTKALLGLFFSTPIILVVLTYNIWKNQYWSFRERVHYTLVVLGALAGVWFLRDLWGLMFWG